MKLIGVIIFIIGFSFNGYCYAFEQSTANPATLSIADKQWKLGFKDENKDSKIQEYVINDENVNNWTELFTFQQFKFTFPKEITPTSFAENEMASLKSKGYQYIYTNYEVSPQEAIIEFRIVYPANEEQDEIQRIIKTPGNQFIIFHYAIRKNDMGEVERTKWVDAIKKINLSLFND